MATAPFVDVKMKGLEKIVPGQTYCIAANHTSALDAFVMALLGDKSNFRSIIKHTLKYYPVFGERSRSSSAASPSQCQPHTNNQM